MKKTIAFMAALVLVFGGTAYLPQQADGADFTITAAADSVTNYKTEINADGTCKIVSYNGSDPTVYIPDYISGRKVTTIGANAFMFNSTAKKIVVSGSVTVIEDSAFYHCSALEEVQIGSKVEIIEHNAFFDCLKLKKVNIPSSTMYLGSGAFANTAVTSISIPNKNCVLDANLFNGCTSLETLTLPGNLYTVPQLMCYGCTSLKSVTLPNTVNTIAASAFRGCTSLRSLTIPASVMTLDMDSVGFDNNGKVLPNFTMYVYAGTAGETYAKKYGVNYKYVASASLKGDVDGNNKVDTSDITALAAHLKGLKPLSAAAQARADVDGDNKLSVNDISLIAAHIKGLKRL